MKNPDNLLKNILKEIRLYESGPSVDGMERLGLKYHKNFGVSITNLKEIAKKYFPNHKLAEKLRTKNFRETIILSFMIDNPKELSVNDIISLLKYITNIELAEQFVLNILEKNNEFYNFAELLIMSDKIYEQICGYIYYARIAQTNQEKEDSFFTTFFEKGITSAKSENSALRKNVARAFRQTALRNTSLKNKVSEAMNKIKEQNSQLSALVWEEVVPLIDY